MGNPWCWMFALAGSGIFVYLCFTTRIYAESALHVFYVLMAIYGYLHMDSDWTRQEWNWGQHMLLILIGAILSVALYYVLTRFTSAMLPLTDAFTTAFSLVATWAMVNYVHENYLYWIVIDAVSVYLYWKRHLYFGAALYAVYCVLVTCAYFELM
jgi:nicotinamide mononucleotide transporter